MPSTFESARARDIFADCAADTMIRSPQAFCLALKAARERRGVSLVQIAAATKVCASHFAALERGDLRSWPKGLFRRAFFRGYVEMVGLPVAETMDEFARLFPNCETPTAIARPADASALRLSLDSSWQGPGAPFAQRIRTAMIDGGAVLVAAAGCAWLADVHPGTATAIVSVSYFTLSMLLLGDSPTASVLRWQRARAAVRRAAVDEPGGVIARVWRGGIDAAGKVFGTADKDTSAERVESPSSIWTTDAPIGPPETAPRFRVRFKLP